MKRLTSLVLLVASVWFIAQGQPTLDKKKHNQLQEKEAYQYPPPNPEELEVDPPPELESETPAPPSKNIDWSWLEPVVTVLIILLIAVGLFFLLQHIGWIQNTRNELKPSKYGTFEGEVENISTLEVKTPLEQTIADKNWRMAVRLYYLDILKHFNEVGWIHWRKGKTNHGYLNELRGRSKHPQFKRFLHGYELVWYGEKHIDESQFSHFAELHQSLTQSQK